MEAAGDDAAEVGGDVGAVFVDGEEGAARGEAAAVRDGVVVRGDDRQEGDGDQARSAALASSHRWSISSRSS